MEQKLEKIYTHSVKILETIGIKLKHPETCDFVERKGIKVENEIAYFTRKQIETWIQKAPESFTLHAKNFLHNSLIGGEKSNFTAGYGCPTIYDINGTSRGAVLKDYIRFAKLIHQTGHFSINGGILAQPNDVPPELSHLIMVYAASMVSDKCLMGIPGNEAQMNQIMDMAAILFGGKDNLKKAPGILTMISTISPLMMDEMALSSIKICARHNQPMIISPAPTAGTTGPIDLAGNIALATAEALAAIVIAQMFRPGVPVIFGLQCNIANLSTGNVSIGSPGYALQAKYTAALAQMLRLPCRCGGSTTDSLCVSPQSGYESMFSLLTACRNNVDLIVHSAGILDNFAAMSYEKFIMDIEMMDMVKYYMTDIEVSPDTLNLDLINAVGPGGQFLTSMDTMKKCRTHSWNPLIGVRGNISRKKVLDRYYENINDKLKQILASYKQPDIDSGIRSELNKFMIRNGVSNQILSSVKDLITQNLEGI